MATSFDVIVIGAGSAGLSAAESARALGATVCVVERESLGGECPNWACLPSKAMLRAAYAYRFGRSLAPFGVAAGGVAFDWKKVGEYRRGAVARVTGGDGARYEKFLRRIGAELVQGDASFADAATVVAGTARLRGKAFVIATGSEDVVPSIPGLEELPFLTSRAALTTDRMPKSLAIVGGGPVGCELATLFSSFGSRVVLIQGADRLLEREDAEISEVARQSLEDAGAEVALGAEVLEAINARGGVYGLRARAADGETVTHAVEAVVVAAGRRPRVGSLALSAAGVPLDPRGALLTGPDQRTGARHIFAAGDADGGLMFTHVAHREGAIAGHNAALAALGRRGPTRKMDAAPVPRVTFVDPELASVGMTEAEGVRAFGSALVGRAHVSALGRAAADGETRGMAKIVVHPTSRAVLGFHAACPRAGEVAHEASLAIRLGATAEQLADAVRAYPTYSELITVAASDCRTR